MTHRKRIEDPARIEAVRASGLLDSAPEGDFDRLARIAAQLLHAPAAFVTVIAKDRQYIKSAVEDGKRTDQAGTSTDLDRSFCQYAVAAGEPFIVDDARQNDLVKDNKAVPDGVIAYAGIPLQTQSGQSIGALCVVDSKPRHWTDEEVENLRALARGAMKLIDDRQANSVREDSEAYKAESDKLADCVAHHLKAAAAYAALVAAPGELNLEAEAEARDRVVQSLADLRHSYEQHSIGTAGAQPQLNSAVARYLDADRLRGETARAFGQGKAELATLEAAIQQHMDAADALRIVAIDHGADL